MDKNFTTREMLDSIAADTRTYNANIERVKSSVEREIFLHDTNFMRGVSDKQAERKKFLADKSAETETLRQNVKSKKISVDRTIEIFRGDLR